MKKSKLLFTVMFVAVFALGIAAACISDDSEPKLISISVANPPARTTYEVGDTFTPANGTIVLVYTDASLDKEISMEDEEVTFDCDDFSTTGTKTVTVKYKGLTDTFEVEVVPVGQMKTEVLSISVSQYPTKMAYELNETFDPAGGRVKLTYNKGDAAQSDMTAGNGFTFEYDFSMHGANKPVKVKYTAENGKFETTFNVKVNVPTEPAGYGNGRKKAPDFTVRKLDSDETVRLSDYVGVKPVFITLWATWCGPCRDEMPYFNEVYQELAGQFEILAISDETLKTITSFKSGPNGKNLKFSLLWDSSKSVYNNGWGTGAMPSNYMIDKWGYFYDLSGTNPAAGSAITSFAKSGFSNVDQFRTVVNGAIARANNYVA